MLEHRCFECSPLATTCQHLRQIDSSHEKGCPSVVEFSKEIGLRTILFSFDVCPKVLQCPLGLVNSRASVPCSFEVTYFVSFLHCSLWLVDPCVTSALNKLCTLSVFTQFTVTGSSTCHLCSTANSGRKRAQSRMLHPIPFVSWIVLASVGQQGSV